jgi:hypothetical protein
MVTQDGGDLTSDAGLLLLSQLEHSLRVLPRVAQCLRDPRQPGKVRHPLETLVGQRVLQVAAGYEDCNDATTMRHDPALAVALGQAPSQGPLASQSTLSRFENGLRWRDCLRLAHALLECFLARHREHPPRRLVLDFDTTDDPTHGQQQFSFYQSHYGCHCYLPLLAFAQADGGDQELVAPLLLPGNAHGATRARTLLRLLVATLRAAFPACQIEFRGDGGFGTPHLYALCEAVEMPYTISLPKNVALLRLAEPFLEEARARYQETGHTVQVYGEFRYRAHSWPHPRRVIVKAEWMAQGANPRFVVTTREDLDPESLYHFYAQRGDVENRIKELKLGLRADRLSCRSFRANQVRLLLHALAYLLLQELRRRLAGTSLASAQVDTLRLKLLKAGALVRESTRRLTVRLASGYPSFHLWARVLPACPG